MWPHVLSNMPSGASLATRPGSDVHLVPQLQESHAGNVIGQSTGKRIRIQKRASHVHNEYLFSI